MPFLASSLPLLLTLLIGMSAAALASLYPAWQAAQRDPAPQLREE
jgi:ABC-type lipoprotein release transport system permease subunit